jgi:hypothetical protein
MEFTGDDFSRPNIFNINITNPKKFSEKSLPSGGGWRGKIISIFLAGSKGRRCPSKS